MASASLLTANPHYAVSIGDEVDVRLWGSINLETRVGVDAQGNIFVPNIGPIEVEGLPNSDLAEVVDRAIRRKYRQNVGVYASLVGAQPVQVFVSGHVVSPGMYGAYSTDSVLHFLDRANGIDFTSGSFRQVDIRREGRVIQTVDLYDFILGGDPPVVRLQDGDTIHVHPVGPQVSVHGAVRAPRRYEIRADTTLARLLEWSRAEQNATDVRLVHRSGDAVTADYFDLDAIETAGVSLQGGDEIVVVSDRPVDSIVVVITGEHRGASQFVLPFDASLDQLLERIKFSQQSDLTGLSIYRKSVAERQKEALNQKLDKLEEASLSARSATQEEASLRTQEAQLIERFVQRARAIEPKGRIVIPESMEYWNVHLEHGDVLEIPRKSELVAVDGEVHFPSSYVYQEELTVSDYIAAAGGYVQAARGGDRVVLLKPNGAAVIVKSGGIFDRQPHVEPGDEVIVLPTVDKKQFQFGKDVIEIIYQLALSAGVVLRL